MSADLFSLLHPSSHDAPPRFERLSSECVEDLCLGDIAGRMAGEGISRAEALEVLSKLTTHTPTIEYRQSIMADFIASPGFTAAIKTILPKVTEMTWYSDTHRDQSSPFLQAIWRLGELELYVDCLDSFHDVFDRFSGSLRSEGLGQLRDLVEERRTSEDYASLRQELPKLKAALRKRKSVTLGINLDERLRPVEAVLLSVNEQPFREQTLLARLFGHHPADSDFETPLPLHRTPRPSNSSLYPTGAFPLAPLFQDLEKLLQSLSRPLVSRIRAYIKVNTLFLDAVRREIAFFIGAAELLLSMKERGMPLCRPVLLPIADRELHAEGFYNLHLALLLAGEPGHDVHREIVTNDIEIGERGRILILTGPNQGGKTTYTQGVGLLQAFAQVGLLVPAASVSLSPVDHIITHFPIRESNTLEQGRLAEEASRLSSLFATVTRSSLILLNESLSSTSPGESLYLAEDIVSAFRMLGLRAIFATHLHELAYRIDEINGSVDGDSLLVSVVAGVAESPAPTRSNGTAQRTFKITVGPPIGKSYARDIAERYGISFDHIREALKKRGVLE